MRLPAWDNLPYDRISPSGAVAAERCAALAALARRSAGDRAPLLVLSTVAAVAQRVPMRGRLAVGSFEAVTGMEVEEGDLERYLLVNGYARASVVRAAGDYAVRGG